MCAVIGAVGHDTEVLKTAAAGMRHRGPDATNFYTSPSFTLGHHRLSVIDLDARANQPMTNEGGNVHIVYNGEIYNFKELRAELSHIRPFRTSSDTEVILRGYEKWGIDVAKKLKGMYAFAILDEREQKVYLARDHVGIKPLYYAQQGEMFVFASELRSVISYLRAKGKTPEVDAAAISLFMAFGYVPSPRTIFKSVFRLPSSTVGKFDIKNQVFRLSTFETDITLEEGKGLESLIEEKVLTHLIADVPVGLFFSGGTDSSLIAAILHKHGVNLSTWSLMLPGKEDREAFEGISKHLGLSSQIAEFGPRQFDEIFEEVFSRIDEPLADNSLLPTYYVSKLAARDVKIVLSGEGGDEYFLGYPRMRELARMRPASAPGGSLDYLFATTPALKGKNRLFLELFKNKRDAAGYYLLATSPGRDLIPENVWSEARRIVAEAGQPLSYDAALYLENDLLRKTDMATMYNSLEGRVPLLDPDIIASAIRLPLSERLSGDVTKAFLKRMLAQYVPQEFVYRGKSGFGLDLRLFWDSTKTLRPALRAAEESLAEFNVPVPLYPEWERYVDRYPNLAFGLITLARSLTNLLR